MTTNTQVNDKSDRQTRTFINSFKIKGANQFLPVFSFNSHFS